MSNLIILMGSGVKILNYQLNKSHFKPLYLQLYEQIREAICQQQFRFGEKLPSKRELKDYLQISQNTIESAYAQLVAEGYIEPKARQGYFVCFQAELEFTTQRKIKRTKEVVHPTKIRFDFNPNRIDSKNFPLQIWRKCGRNCFSLQGENLLGLGDKQGDMALRREIADYLLASRGVHCEAEQIVIGAGVEGCLQQFILLFNQLYPQKNFRYAMEKYGYDKVEKLFQLYDKAVIKLPINSETRGIDLQNLVQNDVNVAYLTPSHLYPFGQVLSISQRQQLLEWANGAEDRFIIEDDYDSEFRYKGKPIPSLQGLDLQGKVIYLGSFSKLIMPGLRISFMVIPKSLLSAYQQYCDFFHSSVSRFEQQRLTNFMQQGEFAKHIQRMRKIYRKKMELLCQLLANCKSKVRYYGEHSGFYLLIEILEQEKTQEKLTALALQQGIVVYPVDYEQRLLFSLGFGDLSENQLQQGVNLLLDIWQLKS